ncbi:MAG: hypothetical protein AAF500_18575 [Myxococcota bacterium]
MHRLKTAAVIAACLAIPAMFGTAHTVRADDSCGCEERCACDACECECGTECDRGTECECEHCDVQE